MPRIEQLLLGGGAEDVTAFGEFETVADRLRASATYIRAHWGRGVLCDENGIVCAVGALLGLRERAENVEMSLLALDPTAFEAVCAIAAWLTEHTAPFSSMAEEGMNVSIVESWNDEYAADGDEVAEVFEKVAARWEERAGV